MRLALVFELAQLLLCRVAALQDVARVHVDEAALEAKRALLERSHLLVAHSHIVQDREHQVFVTLATLNVQLLRLL